MWILICASVKSQRESNAQMAKEGKPREVNNHQSAKDKPKEPAKNQ
jgi:hypothetical protein